MSEILQMQLQKAYESAAEALTPEEEKQLYFEYMNITKNVSENKIKNAEYVDLMLWEMMIRRHVNTKPMDVKLSFPQLKELSAMYTFEALQKGIQESQTAKVECYNADTDDEAKQYAYGSENNDLTSEIIVKQDENNKNIIMFRIHLIKHVIDKNLSACLLYTSPSPRDCLLSRMPSSA